MSYLQNEEFDLLITADPIALKGIEYFRFLNMNPDWFYQHPSTGSDGKITIQELWSKTLVTYPVDKHRLDIIWRNYLFNNLHPKEIHTTGVDANVNSNWWRSGRWDFSTLTGW